jgi:hypothetical protein
MTKHQIVRLLAVLAIAFSVASLVVLATAALQTGQVQRAAAIASFVVLVGAGSRLLKSPLGRA